MSTYASILSGSPIYVFFNFFHHCLFKKDLIYLLFERGEAQEKERREALVCGFLSCAPHQGPGLQPSYLT